jgi:histidinol-phosphate aminotransferase
MPLIENTIRSDIRALVAYHVPDAGNFIKLDAMENPYGLPENLRHELASRLSEVTLNRYPVPSYAGLKSVICRRFGVPHGFSVLLGNGSDELISIMSIACAKPAAKVMAPVPGFVMYEMSAKLAGLEFVGVPLKPDFALDRDAMLQAIERHRPSITYLAYPNNPTGTLFDADDMAAIIGAVGESGIVVVDEAYQPFAEASFMPRLPEFDNLVVMRTVSKLGLAGIRLGYMSANAALLNEFDKARPPYNINVLTQAAAEFMLEHADILDEQAAVLRAERVSLADGLRAIPGVEIFPSAANFLLIRVKKAGISGSEIFDRLLERRVLIKNVGKMHILLENCLRVTVGTPEENKLFLEAFAAVLAA